MDFDDLCMTNMLKAQDEAQTMHHEHVEPEHVLWIELQCNNAGLVEFLGRKSLSKAQVQGVLKKRLDKFPQSVGKDIRQVSSRLKTLIHRAAKGDENTVTWPELIKVILEIQDDPLTETIWDSGISPQEFRDFEAKERELAEITQGVSIKDDVLQKYCVDLFGMAEQGKISDVIGRDIEIRRITEILNQLMINNPLLVGDPGVGKTQIVEGLAVKIFKQDAGPFLNGKRILTLDLGLLIAGANYRGEFEERLKNVIKAVVGQKGGIILFIDEIHTLIGAGKTGGALDAANLLKPALARGDLRVIGATTYGEFRRYFADDPAFSRRFQKVDIAEPTPNETLEILRGVCGRFSQGHSVEVKDQQLSTIVSLTGRFVGDNQFPAKAIQTLDNACARVRIAYQLKEREQAILSDEDIAGSISHKTGIPIDRICRDESERLLSLEERLNHDIIGQPEIVTKVAQRIRMMSLPFRDSVRPRGILLFMGPSGTGKTYLAQRLAEELYDSSKQFVRLDMSEYTDEHSSKRLTGADPGLVGYEEGGLLTEAIRRRPYSLILLDEIDKAHRAVCQQFLQVFDAGRLTDNQQHTVNFSNALFVLTSNYGFTNTKFDPAMADEKKLAADGMEALKRHLGAEFIKRIDDILFFKYLRTEDLGAIIDQKFALYEKEFSKSVESRSAKFTVNSAAKELMIKNGYQQEFGARSLTTYIDTEIAAKLAAEILRKRRELGGMYLPERVEVSSAGDMFDIKVYSESITR